MSTVTVTVTTNDEKQDFRTVFKTTKYILKYVYSYKESKVYTFFSIVSAILKFISSLIMLIFPGLILNELTGSKRIVTIISYVLVISLSSLIFALLRRIINSKMIYIKSKLSSLFLKEYDIKSAMMDYEELEQADIQAESSRVCGTISVALYIIDDLCNLMYSLLTIASTSIIFFTVNPILIVFILIIIFINSLITKRVNKLLHKNSKKKSRLSLFQSYAFLILHYISYAKEVRIFNTKDFFANKLFRNRREIDEIAVDDAKISLNSQILFGITNMCQLIVLYSYFIHKVLFGNLAVGSMMIYMNAISSFTTSLSGIVKAYLNIAKNSLQYQEMINYMEREPEQYRLGNDIPHIFPNSVIEFRNVSFSYPGSDKDALNNLNFRFSINEKMCIVGTNGSGKSTFVKLLLRLYLPTKGEILIDGKNINEFDYEAYNRLFSPVFQDYQLYPISLKENISFSDNTDHQKLDKCIKQCCLDKLVENLPYGYDTSIYKWMDPEGFEPSGGEGQRIAIARALYKGGEIYILDEPTAALDPNAEYEIYTQFHNMIQNKTAIMITHRLSAVQLADKVAVFENGHVAEYGTHAELYAKGGIYTEMFDKQAKFYRDDPNAVTKLIPSDGEREQTAF